MDQANFPVVLACRENVLKKDVTIIPSFLFSVVRTAPEVKFHVFGTLKQGEEKSSTFFFAILIKTLCRFYQVNRKILSYTLLFIKQLSVMSKWKWSIFSTRKLTM